MFTKSQVQSDSDLIFVVKSKLKEYPPILSKHKQSSADENSHRASESHACLLRVYLTFAYCLFISPFRIVKDSSGKNVVRKWVVQTTLCGLATLAAAFTSITDVRKAFPSKGEQWNPVVYFKIFYNVCTLGLTINAWNSLWRKSEKFLQVVEYIDSTVSLPYRTSKIGYTKPAAIICLAYACLGIVSALLGTELMDSGFWNANDHYLCLILEGRYLLFLGPESKNCNSTMLATLGAPSNISSWDHTLAAITGVGQVFKFITAFYWKLFILFGVLSLWLPAAAFASSLKDDVKIVNGDEEVDDDDSAHNASRYEERVIQAASQWPALEEEYISLKELSARINDAFGAMVFSYTFTSIFYYSIHLDAFLLTTDILVRVRLVVLYLGAVVLYILAADICRQVSYLEIWLSEYADDEQKSAVPFHRLTVILNELSTSSIGITGWNVFTITYSVVANMTSVLITYFIICVQFRTPN